MFKSIFAKYITISILIIVLGFSVVSGALVIAVSDFSKDTRKKDVRDAALAIERYTESEYAHSSYSEFGHFVYYEYDKLEKNFSLLVKYSEGTTVILTDKSGEVLLMNSNSGNANVEKIDSTVINELKEKGSYSNTGTLGGIFPNGYACQGERIYNKSRIVVGYVFVCSYEASITEPVRQLTIIIISFTVASSLAVILITYFISRLIIVPLNGISTAAKSFATGKYDVRVPVAGRNEISELAIAFNSMAESIENNEEVRRIFLANVSHDLKSPMTTIAGFVDGMLDGAIKPEDHRHYLSIIKEEVLRLSRLVSSLLDISKIQAGERKFDFAPFDICEMARLILISFEQKIDEKSLEVDFSSDEEKLFALADRDAVYQILYNLCDNAIKFSKSGGLLKVGIIEKEQKLFVSVYNEGVGIAPEDLPYVFDRFYKSDKSRGLDKTGTGLGLYIAKTIINAHNEEIWVKSVYGESCEFVFTLKQTVEAYEAKRKAQRAPTDKDTP